MTDRKDISLLEKHAQTILSTIVAGLIAWVGFSVTEQGKLLATLTERVSSLQSQVEKINDRPALTASDFNILVLPVKNEMIFNRNQIDEIKDRLKALESDVYVKYVNPRKRQE